MIILTRRALPSALFALLATVALWIGDSAVAAAACPTVTYHSNPQLGARRACQVVAPRGTPQGTYIFASPNGPGNAGAGAGIFQDNGVLVWWRGSRGEFLNVVRYNGHSYMAIWSGQLATNGGYGQGSILLYDENYQQAGQITVPKAYGAQGIDLHEFQITPSGYALIGSYAPRQMTVNGHSETVLGYLVEKLSLVQDPNGWIHTGQIVFAWNSINDVPLSQSHVPAPGAGGTWDYFHGNSISETPDGNLLVSSRHTWGIYKLNAHRGTAGFDHPIWEVGAKRDRQLNHPWCYQHDVMAIGGGEYSVFDNGGGGPGCQHASRGMVIWVDSSHRPAGVTMVRSWAHNPPIYTQFTGSTQILSNGDAMIDWANVPRVTEYDQSGRTMKMELELSGWSYRATRSLWDGVPLTKPAVAAQSHSGGVDVWASWNGSTEVAQWQILAGPDASSLKPVGQPYPKTFFETGMSVSGSYATVAVEALNSSGRVLSTSPAVAVKSG